VVDATCEAYYKEWRQKITKIQTKHWGIPQKYIGGLFSAPEIPCETDAFGFFQKYEHGKLRNKILPYFFEEPFLGLF
jgi:hypothetical protein